MDEKTINAQNKPTGLQPIENNPVELKALKERVEQLSEMTDLIPVVSGFREYIEEERRKSQNRMITMTVLFVALAVILVAVPVYMGKVFLEQMKTLHEAQLNTQKDIALAITTGLDGLTTRSAVVEPVKAVENPSPVEKAVIGTLPTTAPPPQETFINEPRLTTLIAQEDEEKPVPPPEEIPDEPPSPDEADETPSENEAARVIEEETPVAIQDSTPRVPEEVPVREPAPEEVESDQDATEPSGREPGEEQAPLTDRQIMLQDLLRKIDSEIEEKEKALNEAAPEG